MTVAQRWITGQKLPGRWSDVGVSSFLVSLANACLLSAFLLLGCYFAEFGSLTPGLEYIRKWKTDFRGGVLVSRSGSGLDGDRPGRSLTVESRYSVDPYELLGPVPWQDLAKRARNDFTRNGSVLWASWFFADEAKERVWSKKMIDELVFYADAGQAFVPGGKALSSYGPDVNQMFFDALSRYPVKGQSVLVIGSETPWIEALCISHAAARVTVVDYRKPRVEDGRITAVSMRELDESDEVFDAIFCYNSIQSDGLGRYGDPINPWADLQHMRKLRRLLQPGGKMFFGVTLGNDTVHFNAHRIYGKILFPQLIRGWKIVTMFGGRTPEQFYNLAPFAYANPLIILTAEEEKK